MNNWQESLENIHRILNIPKKIPSPLLLEALTHSSYHALDAETNDYERLETVGDAVLDLIVVSWLFKSGLKNPHQLTNARSSTVENKSLAKLGKNLRLDTFLRVAPGYVIQLKDLADTIEAIIGSYFLAYGFEECYSWLTVLLKETLQDVFEEVQEKPTKWGHAELNPINILQEFCQKRHIRIPTPELIKIEGSDHERMFTINIEIIFKGIKYKGEGTARKKKLATKMAAHDLCYKLGLIENEF